MDDFDNENEEIKAEIRRLRYYNIELSLKFSKIEVQLSYVKNIAGLFETLFTAVENEFGIPFVWLSLVDSINTTPIIVAVKSSNLLKNRLNIIGKKKFEHFLSDGLKPVLANKDLQPYYKLLPPANKFFIKSLAIIPFQVHDEIAGSWNNGDVVSDRYLPDMDTSHLQKLGQIISTRLTELVSLGNK